MTTSQTRKLLGDFDSYVQVTPLQPINIPYQNNEDSKLKVIHHDRDVSIYEVHDNGQRFEAQQFLKCRLPLKVYLSRKRRIQRLRRSVNFVKGIESDSDIVIISRVPAEGIERHLKPQLLEAKAEMHHDLSAKSYPSLCPSNSAPTGRQLDNTRFSTHMSYAVAASSPRT
ncbi:hypothetical protein K449DRAFT_419881 [Hypoxylon sp. EC38]|nr:hypothetical protein K449DRAFT_419881 [Hypoxylon sp. EC38]